MMLAYFAEVEFEIRLNMTWNMAISRVGQLQVPLLAFLFLSTDISKYCSYFAMMSWPANMLRSSITRLGSKISLTPTRSAGHVSRQSGHPAASFNTQSPSLSRTSLRAREVNIAQSGNQALSTNSCTKPLTQKQNENRHPEDLDLVKAYLFMGVISCISGVIYGRYVVGPALGFDAFELEQIESEVAAVVNLESGFVVVKDEER